jgi:hypothetical protein
MRMNFSIRSAVLRSLALVLVMLAMSAASKAQFRVAITFGPPAIPVYEQPICPGEDYYWVPGTWVLAPEVGFLWTPGWWGWGGDVFVFHEGFWGPEVGFYGGINYGFGYFGEGFEGGRWESGHFFYNRSVTNVNVTNIHNVYNTTVNVRNETRVSFNGGNGGINRRPTPREESAAHGRHLPPVSVQAQHIQAARSNRELRASVNQGRPPIAATPRAGEFSGSGVVKAREAGAPYHPPANRGAGRSENSRAAENNRPANNGSRSGNIVHPKDIPSAERRPSPNTGNAKQDQKYQKQQEKLYTQQDRERQKLQQKQDQEHQRYTQRKTPEARTQQLEQRHQQQTQQLQQKHEAQQQRMQQKQQPPKQSASKPPKEKK